MERLRDPVAVVESRAIERIGDELLRGMVSLLAAAGWDVYRATQLDLDRSWSRGDQNELTSRYPIEMLAEPFM
jgi:hypothetical protein